MNTRTLIVALSLIATLALGGCSSSDDPVDPVVNDTADPVVNDPADSTNPADPADPVDPVDPVDPTDSTNPVAPADPTDPSTSSVLNEQNKLSILEDLLPLIDGTTVFSASNSIIEVAYGRFNDTELAGFTFVDSAFDEESTAFISQFTCDAGGSVQRRVLNTLNITTFTECKLDEDTFNGVAEVDFQSMETNYSYTDFSKIGPSDITRLDGLIEFTRGRNGSAFFSDQIEISFAVAEVSGSTLEDYNVTLSGSIDTDSVNALQSDAIVTRELSSSFSVTADFTGGTDVPIQVTTVTDFVGVQPDDFYTTGALTAEASDGSVLELQADNGDPETLQVTISADEVTTSDTVSWNQNIRLRCLDQTNDASSATEYQFNCGN